MALTLIARVKVKKGMEEKAAKELSWLVPHSRKDKGCLQYDLHQGMQDKTLFMFYERWESLEDLEAHKNMSFMKESQKRTADIFDGPGDVTLWETV